MRTPATQFRGQDSLELTRHYNSIKAEDINSRAIELYIDDDEDGVYELYDPNGGYTYQLVVGELIKIELPLGNTVAKYRLRFVNLTSSVTSGNFTVTTSRN